MTFLDRDRELEFLQRRFGSSRAELLIIYGRRRVGKTELLRRFCEGKPHLFFVGSQTTTEEQLRDFSRVVAALPGSPLPPGAVFGSWQDAIRVLDSLGHKRRFVAVLDEFPYLLAAEPGLASIIQNLWDHSLRRSKLCLILCGSQVSVMESEVLGQTSPLYGRRTGQWQVDPLAVHDIARFFPAYPPEDVIRTYGIVGGMPAYVTQFDPEAPLAENVIRHILSRGTFLYDEVDFLLMQELRDVARYHAALSALAAGTTQLHEIARAMFGPAGGNPIQYLNRLRNLHIVERVVPATVRQPDRAKHVIYRISDPFVRFWFRFAAPNRSALEQGRSREVWEQRIRPQLDQHMGPIFEQVARQHVWRLAATGSLPITPDHVGTWWDREEELDVVAVRHETREAWLAECLWSSSQVHPRELDELTRKAAHFQTRTGYVPRGLGLFSRGPFHPDLRARGRTADLLLVGPADLVRAAP